MERSVHLAKEKLLDTLNENFVSLQPSGEVKQALLGSDLQVIA